MKKSMLLFFTIAIKTSVYSQFYEFDSQIDPNNGAIAVADINNDNKLDVIFSGQVLEIIKGGIFTNNGDGTYTNNLSSNCITPGLTACIAIGDINGDGHLDIIFNGNGGYLGSEIAANTNGIAINDGLGNFELASSEIYPIPNATISCGFADFNLDGLLDYYFAGNGLGNNWICFQQQDGTFIADNSSFVNTHFYDHHVSVVDFNNDSYPDFFICGWDENLKSRYSKTWINDGKGNFKEFAQPYIIQKGYGTASFADVNNDGWLDLLLNGDGGSDGEDSFNIFRLYKNNNGIFEPKTIFLEYRQIGIGGGSRFVDWDNDGDLDIIVGGWSQNKGCQTTVLMECKDANSFTFIENDIKLPGVSNNYYEIADMNNNTSPDLLLMGYCGDYNKNVVGIFPNNNETKVSQLLPANNLKSIVEGNKYNNTVKLSWNIVEGAKSYNIALKNKTTGKWLYNPMSVIGGNLDGWRKTTGIGNAFTNSKWELYNLPEGEYEWTVQGINGNYLGGKFAAPKNFVIGNPNLIKSQLKDGIKIEKINSQLIINCDSKINVKSITIYNSKGITMDKTEMSYLYVDSLLKGLYVVEIIIDNETIIEKVIF